MASTRRRPHSSLKADIFERPQAYDFFQAVRIAEAIGAEDFVASEQNQHAVPASARDGAVPSIRAAVPLGFAAAEVTALRQARGSLELTQTVIGLTGPSGVLPHAFSEMVQTSVRDRNRGLREFFDIFNNRLASLLYEAWAKYRLPVERDRATRRESDQPIDAALRALVGVGTPSLTARTSTPDATLVFFGGLLGRQSRSASAVEHILSGILGYRVTVEQFHGEWLPISDADRTRLPVGNQPGAYCRLGEDSIIGERTFDIQSCVVLKVAPLPYQIFRSLLPDGSRAKGFCDLAALALGADKAFRIRLGLMPLEVPPLVLSSHPDTPEASRLGWNTWLGSPKPRTQPVEADVNPAPHLR